MKHDRYEQRVMRRAALTANAAAISMRRDFHPTKWERQ
jgi:hypothetical protein